MKKPKLKRITIIVSNFAFFIVALLTINLTFYYITLSDLKDNYGFYLIYPKIIGIKTHNIILFELRDTINHEMGHYLYHECIPKEWKAKYSKVYNATQCKWNDDEQEDFAESYAYYMISYLDDLAKEGLCLEKLRYFTKLSAVNIEC